MDTHARGKTVSTLLAGGQTRASLRSSMSLVAPAWGVRVLGSTGDAEDDLFAGICAAMAPDQFLAVTSAARLHGMPLPTRLLHDRRIHVSSPTARARMDRTTVVGHRFKSRTVLLDGIQVESVADTWVHLAIVLAPDELVAVGDWVVLPRRPGALTIEALAATAMAYKRAHFMGVVREALPYIRLGAESPRESDTRMLIVRGGLPEPVVQHEVRDGFGRVMRLDLAWPALKLAVEYDGRHHFEDPEQATNDMRRLRALQHEEWEVIRVGHDDFRDGGQHVLRLIRAAYFRRAAQFVA